MTTIAQAPTPHKVFYAHLFDNPGVLTKLDKEILFFRDDGEIIAIEPDMCNFLTVLGELGIADTQRFMDVLHGCYAMLACTRPQGRQ